MPAPLPLFLFFFFRPQRDLSARERKGKSRIYVQSKRMNRQILIVIKTIITIIDIRLIFIRVNLNFFLSLVQLSVGTR